MKIQLCFIFSLLLLISCSESENEGFLGEWEGQTTVILNGDPVLSNTEAKITNLDGLQHDCEVTANGLKYQFDAAVDGSMLTYSKSIAKNLTDTLLSTYLTGNAELIGDSVLIFDHEVVTIQGSSVLSSVNYFLEFKRKK